MKVQIDLVYQTGIILYTKNDILDDSVISIGSSIMANSDGRHDKNIKGLWYCTDTDDELGDGCIACSLCYSEAPDFFREDDDGYAYVIKQPETEEEIQSCQEQLDGCPVDSIGNNSE